MSESQSRDHTVTVQFSRGQSEVLGFGILAALVLSTIGGVSLVTAPALIEAQESEALNLMSESFVQLGEQLAAARSGQAVNIHNVDVPLGTYTTRPTPTTITVTETVSGTTAATVTFNSTPATFQPTGSDATIVADMGLLGVVRDGESVIRDTPATVTSPTANHTGVRFQTTEYINGSRTVQGTAVVQYVVRPPETGTETIATFERPSNTRNVTLTIKTQHPSLWESYATDTTGLRVDSTTAISNDPRSELTVSVTDNQRLRLTVREFTLERVF